MKQFIVVVIVSVISCVVGKGDERNNKTGTWPCVDGEYPGDDGKMICLTPSVYPCFINVKQAVVTLKFKTRPDADMQSMDVTITAVKPGKYQNDTTYPVKHIQNLQDNTFYDENLPKDSEYSVNFPFSPEEVGIEMNEKSLMWYTFKLVYGGEGYNEDADKICFVHYFNTNPPQPEVDQIGSEDQNVDNVSPDADLPSEPPTQPSVGAGGL